MDLDALRVAFDPEIKHLLDLSLVLIIFGVALELTPADFKAVLRRPRGLIMALVCQFILLPAMAFGLGRLLGPAPSVALGLILVASCPAGSVSNLLAGRAHGNTALSVSVTTASTLLAAALTPRAVSFWGGLDPATAALLRSVSVDGGSMAQEALLLIGLPLVIGVMISTFKPWLAKRLVGPAQKISLLILLVFIVGGLATNSKVFLAGAGKALLPVLCANASALLLGYGCCWVVGLPERDRRAAAFEAGVQNTGLALVLIFRFFDGIGGMAVTAALWGLWNLAVGFGLASYWRKRLA